MPERLFLRVKDVAAELGLSRQRTYRLVRLGTLPAVRVGGRIRVPREAFERWMRGHVEAALAAVSASTSPEPSRPPKD